MRTLAELEQLDFAFIDELTAQEHKLVAVEQRLAVMEERRGQVPEVVFHRVHEDYAQQCNALRATVEPLRQRARQVANELGSLQAQLRLKLDETRLALAELDFRHTLGEFEGAELAERKRPLVEPQASMEQALRRVESAMQKLTHSSGGAEAIAAQQTQETPMQSMPATTAAPVLPPSPPAIPPAPIVAMPPVPPAPPVPQVPAPPPAIPPAPVPEPKAPIRRDATFVFKPGRLLPQSAEAGSEPRTLGMRPINVGSQAGCDVVVAELAPRHVEFRLGRSGFIARDVSPDGRGFKINGVSSEGEVLLADGDTIDIGPARFVLKA